MTFGARLIMFSCGVDAKIIRVSRKSIPLAWSTAISSLILRNGLTRSVLQSPQWRAGPCLAGEANSKFGAPLFVTVANLLETSISNYLLYSILLSIFDFQD